MNDLEDYEELDEEFCSNFDGVINQEVADKLKTGKYKAGYSAWNWHGTVYYDGGYKCQVRHYGRIIGSAEGTTPEELRESLCHEHGGD